MIGDASPVSERDAPCLAEGEASMKSPPSNDLAEDLLGGTGSLLRQMVIAPLAGQELSEHRNPGEDTVVLLTVLVR